MTTQNINIETTEKTRKYRKPTILSQSAVDAGLSALDKLENEAPPITDRPTAKSVVSEWAGRIVALQQKGHSLRRIYEEIKKATKIRVSYKSFQSYLSEATAKQGIERKVTEKKVEKPCGQCNEFAKRFEKNGRAWWACKRCKTLYADKDGKLTNIVLPKK